MNTIEYDWKFERILHENPREEEPKEGRDLMEIHRKFLEAVGKQLGVVNMDDWYLITKTHVSELGGAKMLNTYYKGSLSNALLTLFPEYEWQPWKFSQVPKNVWQDIENHKKYIKHIGDKLGIRKMEDWYQVVVSDFIKAGGGTFINQYYNGSVKKALERAFPEYEWLPWRFAYVPNGFWKEKSNWRQYFDWAGRKLGIKNLDDWYNVKRVDVIDEGGGGVLNMHFGGSLGKALMTIYPEHEWLPWRFEQQSLDAFIYEDQSMLR
jgi:hypothetical protein